MNNFATIQSGGARVVASGSVIAFHGLPIDITLGPPFEGFRTFFAFVDNLPPGSPPSYQVQAITQNILQITLANFNSPLGVGVAEPLLIATNGIDELYCSYWVHTLTGPAPGKTLFYTFYAVAAGGIK